MAKATQPAPETARQAAELEAMRRMLDLSEGTFSLSIAVCNSPALRDHLIEKLQESGQEILVVRIVEGVTDVLGFVRQQIDVTRCSAVFVVDLEVLLPSSKDNQPVLRSLNASRELLERDLHCPVVIWLPEYAAALLSREAPDLWRYRSHRFEFVSEQAGLLAGIQDHSSGNTDLAANLTENEKQFRIAELEQRIKEAGPDPDKQLAGHVTVWLNELAFLNSMLGNISQAEEALHRSIGIFDGLGNQRGVAASYGNLGILRQELGDFTGAEEMHRKALTIYEELHDNAGIAHQNGNLGNIRRRNGDLAAAEQMLRKCLSIAEELGMKGDTAGAYGNLGNVYRDRNDHTAAIDMYKKALVICEELGMRQSAAIQYGNLGNIHETTGDLVAAQEMFLRALAIDEELGIKSGMARQYHNLGNIHRERGDLAAAEDMYRRALSINTDLGRKDGMAKQCASLGALYLRAGSLPAAEEMLVSASHLFQAVGDEPNFTKVEEILRKLRDSR